MTTEHSTRVLVERCDHVSALGFGDGTPGLREQLGLLNEGPRFIVTPLCVFDFHPETHRARLKSLHLGVEVAQVVAQTGFAIEVPGPVPVTPGPSPEELAILRERIDRPGRLRGLSAQ